MYKLQGCYNFRHKISVIKYMKLFKNIYLQHGLGILGLALIFYLAVLIPNTDLARFTWWDKLNHFIAFFVATNYYLLITKHKKQIAISLFFYGILLEGAQAMTATREASYLDILANLCGIIAAYLLNKNLLRLNREEN